MDWKTQYCSDINSPQTDLWGQCNPDHRLFNETDKLILKWIWKCKKPRILKAS